MAEGARSVRARRVGFEKDRGVLAIRSEAGLSFVRVALDARGAAPPLHVLQPLAAQGLSIRFLKLDAENLRFVADGAQQDAVASVLSDAAAPYEVTGDCAVVTVDAPNVRSIPGILARTVDALCRNAVEIFETTDSHSWVSCVIPGERLAAAMAALRGEFGLAADGGDL